MSVGKRRRGCVSRCNGDARDPGVSSQLGSKGISASPALLREMEFPHMTENFNFSREFRQLVFFRRAAGGLRPSPFRSFPLNFAPPPPVHGPCSHLDPSASICGSSSFRAPSTSLNHNRRTQHNLRRSALSADQLFRYTSVLKYFSPRIDYQRHHRRLRSQPPPHFNRRQDSSPPTTSPRTAPPPAQPPGHLLQASAVAIGTISSTTLASHSGGV